jgi:hypothetical protein
MRPFDPTQADAPATLAKTNLALVFNARGNSAPAQQAFRGMMDEFYYRAIPVSVFLAIPTAAHR